MTRSTYSRRESSEVGIIGGVIRALLSRSDAYPIIAAAAAAGRLPRFPVTLFDHIGDVYRRVEIAADRDFPSLDALRLAALVHEEPQASLPTLLASDDLADLVPTAVRVIGEFGDIWKIRTGAELQRYVDVNARYLAPILLFEVAHEGGPTSAMERAAEIAGLHDALARWARRLRAS